MDSKDIFPGFSIQPNHMEEDFFGDERDNAKEGTLTNPTEKEFHEQQQQTDKKFKCFGGFFENSRDDEEEEETSGDGYIGFLLKDGLQHLPQQQDVIGGIELDSAHWQSEEVTIEDAVILLKKSEAENDEEVEEEDTMLGRFMSREEATMKELFKKFFS